MTIGMGPCPTSSRDTGVMVKEKPIVVGLSALEYAVSSLQDTINDLRNHLEPYLAMDEPNEMCPEPRTTERGPDSPVGLRIAGLTDAVSNARIRINRLCERME